MEEGKILEIKDLKARSNTIRKAYHKLEEKHHGSRWTIDEDLLALTNDIGNLSRLAMTRQGRYYDETPYNLEQKLAENIWWLVELSERLEIDVERELERFLADKEKSLGVETE